LETYVFQKSFVQQIVMALENVTFMMAHVIAYLIDQELLVKLNFALDLVLDVKHVPLISVYFARQVII